MTKQEYDLTSLPALVGLPDRVEIAKKIRSEIVGAEVFPTLSDLMYLNLDQLSEESGVDAGNCAFVLSMLLKPMFLETEKLLNQTDAEWWIENKNEAHNRFVDIDDEISKRVPAMLDMLARSRKSSGPAR